VKNKIPIIDAHTHVWRYGIDISEEHAAKFAASLDLQFHQKPGTLRKEDINNTYEDCIRDMDEKGIDKSVVLGISQYRPSHPEWGWMHVKNDYIAEAQNKYPDRLIGFASVDALGRDSIYEIDRAIYELGLKGIGEFAPVYSGLALDDPILDPIYRKCEQLAREQDIPMSIHTGFTYFPWTYMEDQDPALLWHVLEKFPELKIKIDHAGQGGTWDHAIHLALAWPRVYLDFTYLRFTYPPFRIMGFLQHAKSVGVLDRCLWGTDWDGTEDRNEDLDLYRKLPTQSKKYGIEPILTEEDIEALLGGNVEKFLGLK